MGSELFCFVHLNPKLAHNIKLKLKQQIKDGKALMSSRDKTNMHFSLSHPQIQQFKIYHWSKVVVT